MNVDCLKRLETDICFIIYEEFKFKNRYINFYQFEIFAIKAAEIQ